MEVWFRRDAKSFLGTRRAQDPRLLLIFQDDDLVAATAHLIADASVRVINAVAVALPWQGRRLANGNRASDQALAWTLADIAEREVQPAVVAAYIHPGNVRSNSLFSRFGFTVATDAPEEGYRLATTTWERDKFLGRRPPPQTHSRSADRI